MPGALILDFSDPARLARSSSRSRSSLCEITKSTLGQDAWLILLRVVGRIFVTCADPLSATGLKIKRCSTPDGTFQLTSTVVGSMIEACFFGGSVPLQESKQSTKTRRGFRSQGPTKLKLT